MPIRAISGGSMYLASTNKFANTTWYFAKQRNIAPFKFLASDRKEIPRPRGQTPRDLKILHLITGPSKLLNHLKGAQV